MAAGGAADVGGAEGRAVAAKGIAGMSSIELLAWFVLAVVTAKIIAVFDALGMMPGRTARWRGRPWSEAVAVGG